jgi:hypothetical protein
MVAQVPADSGSGDGIARRLGGRTMRTIENAASSLIAWTVSAGVAILVIWLLITSIAYVEAFFGATSYVL